MNISAITAATLTIGAELEALTDEDRAAVFTLLRQEFCFSCGRDWPIPPLGLPCQCENDE